MRSVLTILLLLCLILLTRCGGDAPTGPSLGDISLSDIHPVFSDSGDVRGLAWAPTSDRICIAFNVKIIEIDVATSEFTYESPSWSNWTLSPSYFEDGDRVLFELSQHSRYYIVSKQDGSVDYVRPKVGTRPRLSPDDSAILTIDYGPGKWGIWTYTFADEQWVELKCPFFDIPWGADWHPNSQAVIFSDSPDDDTYSHFVYAVDIGSHSRDLLFSFGRSGKIGGAKEPTFTPDARFIVFASNHHVPEGTAGSSLMDEIFVAKAGRSRVAKQLTQSPAARMPRISPDGTKMAYITLDWEGMSHYVTVWVAEIHGI